MLGHLGINVPDLVQAKQYYDQVMPLLGYEEFVSAADEFAYRPADGKRGTYLFVYGATEASEYSRNRTGLQHLAFMVPTRSAVHEVHRLVVAARLRPWCTSPRRSRSTRRPTTRRSGSTRSASCSKRSATTTATDQLSDSAGRTSPTQQVVFVVRPASASAKNGSTSITARSATVPWPMSS